MFYDKSFDYFFIVPLTFFFFLSCKNGEKLAIDNIQGKWKIMYSEMNSTPNDFMRDGFFEFMGNEVKTNIYGNTASFPFEIDENSIDIKGPEPLTLDLNRFSADSIVLQGSVRNFQMKFGMKKEH